MLSFKFQIFKVLIILIEFFIFVSLIWIWYNCQNIIVVSSCIEFNEISVFQWKHFSFYVDSVVLMNLQSYNVCNTFIFLKKFSPYSLSKVITSTLSLTHVNEHSPYIECTIENTNHMSIIESEDKFSVSIQIKSNIYKSLSNKYYFLNFV